MGEKEDERLFVGKGSDDCAHVSVEHRDVRAHCVTNEREFYASVQPETKCVRAADTPAGKSTESELNDVGRQNLIELKKDKPTGNSISQHNRSINGALYSIGLRAENSSIEKNTKEKVKGTSLNVNNGLRSGANNSTVKHDNKRKIRISCITPRPFVADTSARVVNRNLTRPQVTPNKKESVSVCTANKEPYTYANNTHRPSHNHLSTSLINDKIDVNEETSIRLHREGILCNSNISENRQNNEGEIPHRPVATVDTNASTSPTRKNDVHINVKSTTGLFERDVKRGEQCENNCTKLFSTNGIDGCIKSVVRTNEIVESQRDSNSSDKTLLEMGNTQPRRSQNKDISSDIENSKQSITEVTPSANEDSGSQSTDIQKNIPCVSSIPALIVSDSSLDQDPSDTLSAAQVDIKAKRDSMSQVDNNSEASDGDKPRLRLHQSSDSAYSSDSRCTSMDSASEPSGRTPVEDGDFSDQVSAMKLSPPEKVPDSKSLSSSSSSSSSPSHAMLNQSSDSTLRVISDYGLQRKLSSSSGSSFRSSLSFEESEDDMLSSDGESLREYAFNKGRRESKAQSAWKKIRRVVVWSPFMQSFKKKYPWVQLAGHAGNFQPGEGGCILKKYCSREAECLHQLSTDNTLRPFAPVYHGIVEKEGERYTRMEDLLLAFDRPSVMDCKMGIRTYLEDELSKAKGKPRLRHDMFAKMYEIAPDEPTAEEKESKGVTKARYMQWREKISSSSNLGFRVEGIKKGDNEPSKDYKMTKSEEQVKKAFKYFIDDNVDVLKKYIERLKDIRTAAESSEFFMSHEVIGSSLLFVHDSTGISGIWMIDFGKTSQLPDDKRLSHRASWVEGNREDGYLYGLDNLISIFDDILAELLTKPVSENSNGEEKQSDVTDQKRSILQASSWTFSSQSSAESCGSPAITDSSFDTDSPRKPPLKRQVATTVSYDDTPQQNGQTASLVTNDVINSPDVINNSDTRDQHVTRDLNNSDGGSETSEQRTGTIDSTDDANTETKTT